MPASSALSAQNTVAVIGLGKLGSPIAACFASKGYQVVGVDINTQFIDAINEARAPVYEPGLAELISDNRTRLRATQDIAEAVAVSSLSFVVVPTPSETEGGFSLNYILSACEKIGAAL